jgi:hypothetical protein
MSEPISDETLIAALEARGYAVERKENELAERLTALEAEIAKLRETAPAQSAHAPEENFAASYAKALDRSRSKWFSTDEMGGDDGPQAA